MIPVIARLAKNAAVPVSIDTTKSEVARTALDAGAQIVNDISALRFDPRVAGEAARVGAGLVLMHSRGTLATLHQLPPVADIFAEVISSLRDSVTMARQRGVKGESIVIDPGIGFGKSQEQNIELIAKLDQLVAAFPEYPLLIGTSRKSFLGKLLKQAVGSVEANPGEVVPVTERLNGTMATITAAILRGARIVRVHDVKAALEAVKVADAIRQRSANV